MKKLILLIALIAISLSLFAIFTPVKAQKEEGEATVPCIDIENYGSGPNRARICADGTDALCEWHDYGNGQTTVGKCTLE